ncbi:protein mono-ADP-ribosyltransferase PARP4-like [Halichoeres trimaculatus]|uniref:protein mono-ADP-ribosyltransferase PARP4-like n=1 Tax=Halichoeres trimaculatus TaxID=147232 RepID=UPI003D9F95E9
MAVFENCSVLLELRNVPFKEKKELQSAVTENGGRISFVVNKQCSFIVTSDVSNLSASRLRNIQKFQVPVVGLEYVYRCVDEGVLLPVNEYELDVSPPVAPPPPVPPSSHLENPPVQVSKVTGSKVSDKPTKGRTKPEVAKSASLTQTTETPEEGEKVSAKSRSYTETDSDLPTFPDDFQVAKYSIFEKLHSNTWYVLELQSFTGKERCQYRVVRYLKEDISSKKTAVRDMLVFLSTSEEALEVYQDLRETLLNSGLKLRTNLPPQAQTLGSDPLQQLLLEEKLSTGSLSEEVGVFVELLWTEALGCLSNILAVPVNKLSLNDVSRVEGLLLQAQRKLKEEKPAEVASLMEDVYTLLPHRVQPAPPTVKLISQKLDLCQLIRDMLNVSEMTLRSPVSTCLGKYRALRCSIEAVPPGSSEFQAVTAPLQHSTRQIQQVLRVSRGVELQTFRSELENVRGLLHSTSPSNLVGVLSRGLLLPRVGVEHHGIERTDIGNLGSGIYFTDSMGSSLKYSKPSETDGSRLLLVCDVALGKSKTVNKKDSTLTEAPEGFNSVLGLRRSRGNRSDFEDNEYVVYSPDQVKLKYVVKFSVEGDQLKEFSPAVNTSAEPRLSSSNQELTSEDDGVENVKNPLEDVTAGLLDSSGQQLPLQAVHVKCKLVDLLSQVVIFQKYTNQSSVPIEAKYVFPLDDSAAVCGFEAFINGKHVVGQVKEKEKARKEYKQAIEKGHGAYLMDQDAPDVFTISVGNLPPGATVLIKVTFVSELIIKNGEIIFSLPGSVAPWQESAALNQTTQATMEKVCVTDEAASTREFTLDISIEMPREIIYLSCLTHIVNIKKTDCKAVVSVLPGQVMTQEGFRLSIIVTELWLPRMWVENHPEKDSQACMLVFYPDFDDVSSSATDEVVLLIDTSESMKGESLCMAQKIALQVLKHLDDDFRVNVVLFGTDHKEAFLTAQPLKEAHQTAKNFIKSFTPVGGSTELWRPLRALSLLPPSCGVRNLLLLSDGHIQNSELTLKLLRENARHSRLFTCGLSPTANRHMLRALAQAGGGAYEFFDTKTKHTWAEKVACQLKRIESVSCSSVSVKWQQFNPTAPPPVQAPKQLHALFSACPTLVFGFVPHCTQATLRGNLSGQELETMVSTTELQKTKGTFLHKLTARAVIRDYEDGSLDTNEAEHEGKKAELKDFIINLSKEFSILSQFTSFVAIEERDPEQTEEGFTDIPKLIAEEDVDILPYLGWIPPDPPLKGMDFGSDDEDEGLCYGQPLSCVESIVECELEEYDAAEDSSSPKYDPTSPGSEKSFGRGVQMMKLKSCALEDDSSESSEDDDLQVMTLESCAVEDDSSESSEDDDLQFMNLRGCTLGDMPVMEMKSYVPEERSFERQMVDDMSVLKRRPVDRLSSIMTLSPPAAKTSGPPPTVDSEDNILPGSPPSFVSCCFAKSDRDPAPPVSNLLTEPRGASFPPPRGVPLLVGATAFGGLSLPPPPPPASHHRGAFAGFGSKAFSAPPPPPPPPRMAGFKAPLFGSGTGPPPMAGFKAPLFGSGPPPPPMAGFKAPLFGSGTRPPPMAGFKAPLFGSGTRPPPMAGFKAPLFGSGTRPPPMPGYQALKFGASLPPPPMAGFQAPTFGGGPAPPSFDEIRGPLKAMPVLFDSLPSPCGLGSPAPPVLSDDLPSVKDSTSEKRATMRKMKSEQIKKARLYTGDVTPSHHLHKTEASRAIEDDGVRADSAIPETTFAFGRCQPKYLMRSYETGLEGETPQHDYVIEEETPSPPGVAVVTRRKSRRMPRGTWSTREAAESEAAPERGQPKSTSEEIPQELLSDEREQLMQRLMRNTGSLGFSLRSADSEAPALRWSKIFQLQHPDGYWEISSELGDYINVDVEMFANVFLKNKGINSLGERAREDILRLVATLLVLQLMRMEKLEEGKRLCTLFRLDDSSQPRPERWEEVKKAVDWVRWADQQYPCVYSRLEFGLSWESSTRQLLGYEALPPFSPLSGLTLQKSPVPLLVH